VAKVLYCDFETRSLVDLTEVGADIYAADPSTEAWCVAYQFDDGETEIWIEGEPLPEDVREHVEGGGRVSAWNVAFELAIWNKVMAPRHGWPTLKPEQCECSMARAAGMSLPLSLDKAGQALRLKIKKDMGGRRLMLQMSRPRSKDPLVWWDDDEEKKQKLYAYCKQDVRTEYAVGKKTRRLSEAELAAWQLDYHINQRGIPVDLPTVRLLIDWCNEERARLDGEMHRVTEGAVRDCSDVAGLAKFAGVKSVAKAALEQHLKRAKGAKHTALELRQSFAKTSTKKLDALLRGTGPDGNMLGTFQFCGAGSTGRWAGRRVQAQNLPRPAYGVTQEEIERRLEEFDFDSLQDVADCLRAMIAAPDGKTLVAGDFVSVEAIVLAWFADETSVLDVFRDGKDLYKQQASGIYRVPYAKVSKDQRQIGKVACIAEGELVLTDHGLIPIEQVPCCSRVWDGVAWVAHDGPIYKGIRNVIEYQGLRATPDHAVWSEAGRQGTLEGLAGAGIRLAQTGVGRVAIRLGEGGEPALGEEERPPSPPCGVCGLPRRETGGAQQPAFRQNERLPKLLATEAPPQETGSTTDGGKTALQQPGQPGVGELRGPRDRISVLVGAGGRALDHVKLGLVSRAGARPDRQRRPLRSRQLALGDTCATEFKQADEQVARGVEIQPGAVALRREHGQTEVARGQDPARDTARSGAGGAGEAQRLAEHKRQARVYDLLNCGPRHRFTVSGVLVHNCLALGYQGAYGAFVSMAAVYGMDALEKHFVEGIVKSWRAANPKIVQLWEDTEETAFKACKRPGKWFSIGRSPKMMHKHGHLWMKLPSGRNLCFPKARIREIEKPWGRGDAIVYQGENSYTRKVEWLSTYGGKLVENLVQATARELLLNAMHNVTDYGFDIVLHVHDEICCLVEERRINDGTLDRFLALLCKLPDWAEGMPLRAEGWVGKRFRKD